MVRLMTESKGEEDVRKMTEQNGRVKNGGNGKPTNENGNVRPTEQELVEPPDGGWGWMVVLASFLIHIIADGIVYSFGIFYMEFLDYFKGGKGETAWVGSLVPGVTLSVGPIASILTNKYGCRVTTIAGAIIAACGFILSLFAPNLYFLYFSFGILSGLGFGLIYLPAIVSVGYYFEKKRAFATGLAVCGSGLGAFIFNPFAKFLIDEYGWRGAILIEAGIILNCVLCGALFRPLQAPKRKRSETEPFLLEKGEGDIKSSMQVMSLPSSPTDVSALKISTKLPSPLVAASDGALHKLTGNNDTNHVKSSIALHNRPHNPRLERMLSDSESRHRLDVARIGHSDIMHGGSLMNISIQRSHPALYIASVHSIPGEFPDGEAKLFGCIPVSPELYRGLKQMLDFSLLKDVIFLMFVISNFFTSIGFNMPFIYLPDRAVDEGFNQDQAKWLVSAVGISNTVGRVLFGFLSDRPGVNRLMLYNTALMICGIATAISPFCYNYPLLVLYACLFGLFIGVYVSLTSIVLVDLLGLEMLTNSFGLLLMFQGIATLIGPPIAGWLYDGTGSYDVSFAVEGSIVAVSGIMLYAIPCVRKCLHREPPCTEFDMDAI